MVPHCGFDLHFSDNEWYWASFHAFVCMPSVCLLWRNVYLFLWPIFWLGHLFFWYWAVWAAFVFLRLIIWQLLHLVLFSPNLKAVFSPCNKVSFIVQKLLSLIRSHLFIFLLFPLLWEMGHRGCGCDLCQRVFCLCFPQHYPQWWKNESFCPKVRNKTRVPTLTTTIQHSFGNFSHNNQRRKRNKRNPDWKRRGKTLTVCGWHDPLHRKL